MRTGTLMSVLSWPLDLPGSRAMQPFKGRALEGASLSACSYDGLGFVVGGGVVEMTYSERGAERMPAHSNFLHVESSLPVF